MHAYLNGHWIDYSTATVPVWDYGFAMGVSVTEQLRTFGGKLVHPEWNFERLLDGLEILNLPAPLSSTELAALAQSLIQKNVGEVPAGGDMGIGICVTPGPLDHFAPSATANEPTVVAYSYALRFEKWASTYATGMSLSIVDTREIPESSVPRKLKCRSRMHYYLAEQEAAAKSPGSRALLLDAEGNVAEATVATVVMVEGDTIIVPPAVAILPGTALRFLLQLCEKESITVSRERISPSRIKNADEVFWLSTPVAMLPVTQIDQQPIGSGKPGEAFARIMNAWSARVGVDIVAQATAVN